MCVETLTGVLFWSSDLLGKPFRAAYFPFETLSGSLLLFVSFHSDHLLLLQIRQVWARIGVKITKIGDFAWKIVNNSQNIFDKNICWIVEVRELQRTVATLAQVAVGVSFANAVSLPAARSRCERSIYKLCGAEADCCPVPLAPRARAPARPEDQGRQSGAYDPGAGW